MAAIVCTSGPPCMPGKTARSIAWACSSVQRMNPARGPASVLCVVEVTKWQSLTGFGCSPAGDEAREVRHVAEQQRADLVRDLAEAVGLDRARVGRAAADDQLRPVLLGERENLVVVDQVRLARDAVVDDRVEPPAEVDLQPVRQVPAVRELEREDRVARLQRCHVDGHVRLRARVRLDVRVLGAEQLLGAVDRRLLDLVDDLAAAVVALAGIALGVLVRRHGADRLEDRRPGEVLGGDQLDLAALALELAAEQLRDRRVDLREPGGLQVLDGLLRDRHAVDGTQVTCRRRAARSSASAAGTAPSRRTRGSAPVRSSTVEGVPGSSPPSTTAPAAARISAGTSSSVRVSGPPCRFALVATTAPTCCEHLGARPGQLRHAHADRLRGGAGQRAEALLGVRQHQRVRPGQQRLQGRTRQLRDELEQRLHARRQQRERLLGRPLLQPVDLTRRGLARAGRRRARRPCRWAARLSARAAALRRPARSGGSPDEEEREHGLPELLRPLDEDHVTDARHDHGLRRRMPSASSERRPAR